MNGPERKKERKKERQKRRRRREKALKRKVNNFSIGWGDGKTGWRGGARVCCHWCVDGNQSIRREPGRDSAPLPLFIFDRPWHEPLIKGLLHLGAQKHVRHTLFFFYFFCPLLKKQKKTKADLLDCDGRRFGRFLKKKNKKKLITCSQVSILIRFRLVGTGSPTTRRIPRLIASRRR